MVWCNPEGEEHLFTFADMKTLVGQDGELSWPRCGVGQRRHRHGHPAPPLPVLVRGHRRLAKLGAVDGAGNVHAQGARPGVSPERRRHQGRHLPPPSATIARRGGRCGRSSAPSVEHLYPGQRRRRRLDRRSDAERAIGSLPSTSPVGAALSGPEGVCAVPGKREGWHDFNTGVRDACEPNFTRARDRVSPTPCSCISPPVPPATPRWCCMIPATPWRTWSRRSIGITSNPTGCICTIADTGWGKAVWGKYYGQWLMEACSAHVRLRPLPR